MSAILTLTEYKKRRQIVAVDAARDEALEAALASAEDEVLKYTDRDFTKAEEAETREYPFEIHATVLDTDDFVGKPTLIEFEVPGVGLVPFTTMNAYWLGPREGPTSYYIDFTPAKVLSLPSIGAMGFTRNLDRYYGDGAGQADAVTAKITAVFGWPGGAPAGVQQAVAWLVDEFVKAEGNEGELQAEGIAGLSYVYQRAREEQHELPSRVMALLDPYRRQAL